MKYLLSAFLTVFKESLYRYIAIGITVVLLVIYYLLFAKTTSFVVFFSANTSLYVWLSIISTILVAVLFATAFTYLIWQWRNKINENPAHFGNNLIGGFLGAISIGCPICGAFILSLLGIAGGLAIFPFQGLEIKAFSMILLGISVYASSKSIVDKKCCGVEKDEILLGFDKEKFVLNLNRKTILPLVPAFLGFFLLFLTAYLPAISNKFDFAFDFQKKSQASLAEATELSDGAQEIFSKINPDEGVIINAVFGDAGPKMIAAGVIDFEKMKSLYEQNGSSLTEEQIKILTEGSNEKIKISQENSYFLLNFLWALGLANKNPVLDEGAMTKYGEDQLGNFASTGGWTLGKKNAMNYYSKFQIVSLNSDQQAVVEDFANNAYRPCCSNPTSFPDCNHGMAALALGELMASQGATADEIFEAFKYLNAFWFPQTYFDVAKYFEAKEGKSWEDVSARIIAGKEYSTPQGWQSVRMWLQLNNLLEEPPAGGGGCGV